MQIEKPKLAFRGKLTPIKKVTKLVCHHPAHPRWGIVDIHNSHKNSNGWAGIGYNYFITKDGRIQEGRGNNVGAHCKNYNSTTLGICFQGNFEFENMTDAQVRAGGWLIAKLIREHGLQINDVIGHRDLAATACPGKNFRMADLKEGALRNINPNVVKEEVKVAETSEAKVMLNDNKSIPAIIKDGRTFVQVRDIADLLGLKIVYNNESKTTKLYTK